MTREAERINAALDELKVADDLRAFEYISLGMMLTLAENNVRTLDDLADLDNEELIEYLGQHGLTDDNEAGDIIMAALRWFADEDLGEDADQGADSVEPDSDAAPAVLIAKSCLGSLHGRARLYHHWADLTHIG